jgi:hypothetical protein
MRFVLDPGKAKRVMTCCVILWHGGQSGIRIGGGFVAVIGARLAMEVPHGAGRGSGHCRAPEANGAVGGRFEQVKRFRCRNPDCSYRYGLDRERRCVS